MSTDQRSMNWCFTWNNPQQYDDNVDWSEVAEPPNAWSNVQYVVWQLEQGESGTPHYQGYAQFTKRMSLKQLKEELPAVSHWEARRGTHEKAKAYCMKEDSRIAGPWEHGQETHQGVSQALYELKNRVKEGKSDLDLVELDPATWFRYYNAIKRLRTLMQPQRGNEPVYTTIIWGPTGTGKSRRAEFEAGPGAYRLMVPQGQTFQVNWDGYAGEEDVIIEEFEGQISIKNMLALCDRYPLRKNYKGGSVMTNVRRVWITSNDNPITWWPNKGFEPFARRVSGESGKIIHQITPWVSTTDGELLAADVEEAYKKMEQVARDVAATMQRLDDLLPADHPQKKRRLAAPPPPTPLPMAMGMRPKYKCHIDSCDNEVWSKGSRCEEHQAH